MYTQYTYDVNVQYNMVINPLFDQSVNCRLWKEKNFNTNSLARMVIKLYFFKKKIKFVIIAIFLFYCRFKLFI